MTESKNRIMQCFAHDWRTTVLTLVLLPLMVSLGFWQLSRADEKRSIQQNAEKQQLMPPLALEQLLADEFAELHYRKVSFSGHWQSQTFLLDNQVQNGKVGYHVVSLMKLDDGRFVLVNRGWVAMNPDRSRLPDIALAASGQETGDIYMSEELMKNTPVYAEAGWPRRVQRLHLPALSRELGVELMPVMVRLQPDSPSALQVQWSAINMLPEKHEAYAIQWFAMSAALIIFYLLLGFRANNQQNKEAL